jgi:hypothetical protein
MTGLSSDGAAHSVSPKVTGMGCGRVGATLDAPASSRSNRPQGMERPSRNRRTRFVAFAADSGCMARRSARFLSSRTDLRQSNRRSSPAFFWERTPSECPAIRPRQTMGQNVLSTVKAHFATDLVSTALSLRSAARMRRRAICTRAVGTPQTSGWIASC